MNKSQYIIEEDVAAKEGMDCVLCPLFSKLYFHTINPLLKLYYLYIFTLTQFL